MRKKKGRGQCVRELVNDRVGDLVYIFSTKPFATMYSYHTLSRLISLDRCHTEVRLTLLILFYASVRPPKIAFILMSDEFVLPIIFRMYFAPLRVSFVVV